MTHVLNPYALHNTIDAAAQTKPLPAPKLPEPAPLIVEDAAPGQEEYGELYKLMRSKMMQSVCKEVQCPNFSKCWGK